MPDVSVYLSMSYLRSSNLVFCFRFSPWYSPSFPVDRVTLRWQNKPLICVINCAQQVRNCVHWSHAVQLWWNYHMLTHSLSPCLHCFPGYYKIGTCDDPVAKYKCKRCETNTFTETPNFAERCLRCAACNRKYLVILLYWTAWKSCGQDCVVMLRIEKETLHFFPSRWWDSKNTLLH